MPPYLYNRPRHIVQHCLDKTDLANAIPAHHVISKGDGKFEVHSQTPMLKVWYKVSFGGQDATPSCMCDDWQRTHLPCKHMFAIFKHKPDWGFESLSKKYRNSPFFTLDEVVILPIDNLHVEPAEFSKEEPVIDGTKESHSQERENNKENLPYPKRFNKTVAAQCRDLMNQAKSLTFIVDDPDTLEQVRKTLQRCVVLMKNSVPKAYNGLILEQNPYQSTKPIPRDAPKVQSKKTSKTTHNRLPLARRKNKYSGRVGQVATNLKEGWHVDPFKTSENSKPTKMDLEVEIVGDILPEDCNLTSSAASPQSPQQVTDAILKNDESTSKPALADPPTDQPLHPPTDQPLHPPTNQPLNPLTDTCKGRVDQKGNSLKRQKGMEGHCPVHYKKAKIDHQPEFIGDDLPEVTGSANPSKQDKENMIIIDENSPDTAVWINHNDHITGRKITLHADSKKLILKPNGWLYDSEVEAAQNLLKMKFPLVDGLEDPAIVGKLVTPATSEFVQIINTGAHWVCISTLSCPPGTVKVYDSLFGKPSIKAIQHACRMLHHKGKTVTIINEKVQKQKGSNDCALFAIAFATTLCNGKNPTTTQYDQRAMRSHLVSCLEALEMKEFPTTKKRVPLVIVPVASRTVPIYCTCRLPNDNTKYVLCDGKCSEWYHPDCANIPDSVINNNKRWMCFECRHRKK